MTSYQGLLNKLETFFNNHLQVKKFGGEFREQMPNFSTLDERYPLVYVVPTSETSGMNTNVFTLDIYCVDIIQKDRANINTILSDCQLILNDLYLYYTDGTDLSVTILTDPTMTPVNNFDLDYVAGWFGTFTFEVDQYSVCAIPIEPITPVIPECDCDPATVNLVNTNDTLLLTELVDCGTTETIIAPDGIAHLKLTGDGTLINLNIPSGETVEYDIPDNDITVNGGDLFTIDATEPLDILLLDQNANTINAQSVTHNQNQDHVEIVINTSSFVPVGATLQKTGQTTSYHQDDDGATERGRLVNFFTLPSSNPFGNTNRFTNKTGGQIYTNSVAFDWSTYNGSTVLAYYFGDVTTRTWINQLSAHKNATHDGLMGWDLVNFVEMVNIMNFELMANYQLNYAPFNTTLRYFWISTQPSGTGGCATDLAGVAPFVNTSKTNALYGLWVRVCNVSGTNIT